MYNIAKKKKTQESCVDIRFITSTVFEKRGKKITPARFEPGANVNITAQSATLTTTPAAL